MKKYAAALGIGLSYAGFMLVLDRDEKGGVVTAIAGGVIFALIAAWQMARNARKGDDKRALYTAEGIVKDAPAVLASGAKRTQGWLFLTKRRLVFEPTARGQDAFRFELALADVEARNATGMLSANKLAITAQGTTHHLLIQDRELWVVTIKHAATATEQAS